MIGVGAMIGAGIFVLIGIAAGATGPSVMLALALNGVLTLFTAMVYAELGSAIPEAGGGYLWVRDALGRQQSFLAGWMSWFSHAVAGALYALGFGSFLNLLLERGGVPFLDVPLLGAEKTLGVLIVLVFLAINFRGASETGLAGNVVTLAKLIVIALFIGFGLYTIVTNPNRALSRFDPMFPQGPFNVFLAMGITFIAFEGYEIIVQAGEEVQDPRRSIPRAVFKSLLIVIPVYVLVAIAAIGAVDPRGDQPTWRFLGQAKELGLALAAGRFMPFGTVIILIGGLLSTMSALNATTFSSTRVSFAMGRDRVMPDAFAKIHSRFRTPYIALAATGLLMILIVVAIPIEDVAAAADVMFLLLFLQVNYAILRIRGEFGDRLEYGYMIRWYPAIPIAGIVANLALAIVLFQFSPIGWLSAIGWIAAGIVFFFFYARPKVAEDERPRVTFEEKGGRRKGPTILAPVANPEHVPTVVTIAAALARQQDAEVVVLNVIRMPEQLPMSEGYRYAERAEPVATAVDELAERFEDVPISTVVAIGRRISQVINDIAEREGATTLVLGWRGKVQEQRVRGSVVQEVLRSAPSQVLVVKDVGLPARIDEVLVAASPGLRSRDTVETGLALARGFDAHLRLVTVVSRDGNGKQIRAWLEEVKGELAERLDGGRFRAELVESESPIEIMDEEAGRSAFLVVGASRDWALRRRLTGEFADKVANAVDRSVVVVKPSEHRAMSLWRLAVRELRRPRPSA